MPPCVRIMLPLLYEEVIGPTQRYMTHEQLSHARDFKLDRYIIVTERLLVDRRRQVLGALGVLSHRLGEVATHGLEQADEVLTPK